MGVGLDLGGSGLSTGLRAAHSQLLETSFGAAVAPAMDKKSERLQSSGRACIQGGGK